MSATNTQIEYKTCSKCGETKELNRETFRFRKDKRRADGGCYGAKCWTCERKHQKEYDQSRKAIRRKWNKEKRDKEKDRKWREENKERISFYKIAYNKNKQFDLNNTIAPGCKSIKHPIKCKYCKRYSFKKCKDKRCLELRDWYVDMKSKYISFDDSVKLLRYKLSELKFNRSNVCNKSYLNSMFNLGSSHSCCSNSCRVKNEADTNRRYRRRRRGQAKKVKYFLSFRKREQFRKQDGRCNHCNIPMNYEHKHRDNDAEVDHIIPLSKGGLHWDLNLHLLCRSCNNKKGDTLIVRQLKQG